MSKSVVITPKAYIKIGLHLSKYYYAPVVGYLIGKISEKIEIDDILAVCHSVPGGPILEMSGDVADKMGNGTVQVIGLYFSDSFSAGALPVFVDRMIENMQTILQKKGVYLISNTDNLVDNSKLFLDAFSLDSKNALDISLSSNTVQETNKQLNTYLQSPQLQAFSDFEDHMNSCGAGDFRNTFIQ